MLPAILKRNSDIVGSWFDDINHVFNQQVQSIFNQDTFSGIRNKIKDCSFPRLDVYTKNDTYHIQASVPGVKDEDLSVEIVTENKTRYVKISGKMSEEVQDAQWHLREFRRSKFVRAVSLPDDIIGDPEAEIKDGVLSLSWQIPKELPQADTKKIILKKV